MEYAERRVLEKMAEIVTQQFPGVCKDLENELNVLTKPSKVFVYGTLRVPDAKIYYLEDYRIEAVYRSGLGFPIVIPDKGKAVVGNVREYSPADMTNRDQYEGCENGLYTREMVKVVDTEGNVLDTWVYLPLDERLYDPRNQVIESGDWFKFKEEQKKAAHDRAVAMNEAKKAKKAKNEKIGKKSAKA